MDERGTLGCGGGGGVEHGIKKPWEVFSQHEGMPSAGTLHALQLHATDTFCIWTKEYTYVHVCM